MTRNPRRRPLGNDAVSDVVGQLLMVAATVAVGGGFVLILLSLPPPAEQGRVDVGAFILPRANDRLVLEHRGGDAIRLTDLQVVLVVNQTRTVANVGDRVAAADPAWRVVDAAGATKASTATWRAGDQVWYTSADLRGQRVRAEVVDLGARSALLVPTVLQESDSARPTLASARTTGTTTIQATFTERLYNVSAADFTITGLSIQTVRLVGLGDQAVFTTTTAFATSATPTVTVTGTPGGTYDLAGNRLTGSTAVVATDGAAPTLTFSSSSATNTSITIHFNTSETATPTVEYGPTLVFGLSASGPSGTSHAVTIGSLTSGTTYHYRIFASDAAGNNNTGEPSRSQATLGASAGGGGGSGTAPNYLEWTTVATPLNPGIVSSTTYTITLRNSAGAAVTPSNLEVRLLSNSTRGIFYDSTGTSTIDRVVMSTSTATIRYADHRPRGVSLLTATANNTVPATTLVYLNDRGNIVPSHGDTIDSVLLHVIYPPAQDRNELGVLLGLNIVNPTPTAKTLASIVLDAFPSAGTGNSFFFRDVSSAPSDVACTWSGSGSNTIACSGLSANVGAYNAVQLVVAFRTSDSGGDRDFVVKATATFSNPSGSISNATLTQHWGTGDRASMVRLLGSATSGGSERAAFNLGTGGAAKDLYFRWYSERIRGTTTLHTQFIIPAGWTAVSVQGLAGDQTVTLLRQPTPFAPGVIALSQTAPNTATSAEIFIRATPPTINGIDLIQVQHVTSGGDPYTRLGADHTFGVKIGT